MVQLPLHMAVTAIAENVLKGIGLTALLKRMLRRGDCGGVRWAERPIEENLEHILGVSARVLRLLGDVTGKVGVELGPGDNLGVSYAVLKAGASMVYAVEKYGSVAPDQWCARVFAGVDGALPNEPRADAVLSVAHGRFDPRFLRLERSHFEDFRPAEPVDFIFSHDVLEHVDPRPIMSRAFELLRPGGVFANVVDLTGHGVFYNMQRPLDFLTCPDWLWRLMFSNMETTNRVRFSEFIACAQNAGFDVSVAAPLRRADPGYLQAVRPHLLPRYRRLADDDLSVMQCVLVLKKLRAA